MNYSFASLLKHLWFKIILVQLVAAVILYAASSFQYRLAFLPQDFLDGKGFPPLWTWATHILVPGSLYSIAVNLLFLWLLGSRLEAERGPATLGQAYAIGVLIPPIVAFLVPGNYTQSLISPSIPVSCVLAATAGAFPHQPSFFGLKVMWMATIIIGLNFLQCLDDGRYSAALGLAVASGLSAWATYRGWLLPWIDPARRFSKQLAAPSWGKAPRESALKPRLDVRPEMVDVQRLDDLLEKISREGMHSLTPEERQRLERTSETLRRIEDRSKL